MHEDGVLRDAFDYDESERLHVADVTLGHFEYDYDANGNRQSVTHDSAIDT